MIFRVTAHREPSPNGPNPSAEMEPWIEPPDENYDLPAVGVTGPYYRLDGIPADKALKVRSGPQRTAAEAGQISGNAREILVLACEPYIDAISFEEASLDGKRRLLGGSWCEIQHPTARGFIPGTYLVPQD